MIFSGLPANGGHLSAQKWKQSGQAMIPVHFNLNTLHMVFEKDKAEELEKKLTDTYGYGSKVLIMELRKVRMQESRDRRLCLSEYLHHYIMQ